MSAVDDRQSDVMDVQGEEASREAGRDFSRKVPAIDKILS
jgi:hypothetical protein